MYVILFKYNGNILLCVKGEVMPEITFKRAVFKSGNSYRINIPMEIVRALNIQEKEQLTICLRDDKILITKSPP